MDYERTAQYFFHLADVRFRLLALLPIVSGTALVLVPDRLQPAEMFALGILGLVATLGVLLYDQRNSQIYNGLVGRLYLIEESLRLPALRPDKQVGGPFIDRPGGSQRRKLFGIVYAHHGLGLNLIYSASVAAWLFVITRATLPILGLFARPQTYLLFLLPALLGVLLFRELCRIDDASGWEGEIPEEVKKRIDKPKPKAADAQGTGACAASSASEAET